jgi:hypothetical protein
MKIENFAHVPDEHPAAAFVTQAKAWLDQNPVDGEIPATHPAYWVLNQAQAYLAAQPLPELEVKSSLPEATS